MQLIGRERDDYVYSGEYVRNSSLELISREIYDAGLTGSVAELGVYRGDFAQYINKAFPDRKLYLFDTFEGFDNRDKKKDIVNNFSTAEEDFSDTSIDIVMKKMKYTENCIIKKGYFPESANGIEDRFVFVSIDTDLYEPIYAGLCWFYPRMQRGGAIFVHDYNNIGYKGAKKAVLKFCKENNICFFPLSDCGGSAVIMKV